MFYRGLQDVKEQKNTKFGNMGEVAKKGSFLLLPLWVDNYVK